MSRLRRSAIAAAALCLVAGSAARAEIIDRIVAIVGEQEIAASDVDRQLRLEALFEDRPVDDGPAAREQALERLIDQTLIANDVGLSGLPPLSDQERGQALAQLKLAGFGSSGFDEAVRARGVEVAEVADFLAAQIQFTRYLAFRFRTGQIVSDEEIEAAYRARYRDSAAPPPLDQVSNEIREETLDARATNLLEERVRQMRAEARVVWLDPMDHDGEGAP